MTARGVVGTAVLPSERINRPDAGESSAWADSNQPSMWIDSKSSSAMRSEPMAAITATSYRMNLSGAQ